eukprot:1159276-Pelagomonas_calceolata.AAC.9
MSPIGYGSYFIWVCGVRPWVFEICPRDFMSWAAALFCHLHGSSSHCIIHKDQAVFARSSNHCIIRSHCIIRMDLAVIALFPWSKQPLHICMNQAVIASFAWSKQQLHHLYESSSHCIIRMDQAVIVWIKQSLLTCKEIQSHGTGTGHHWLS